jgi:hypothetical protein
MLSSFQKRMLIAAAAGQQRRENVQLGHYIVAPANRGQQIETAIFEKKLNCPAF